MINELDPDLRDRFTEHVDERLRTGFLLPGDVVESATQLLEDLNEDDDLVIDRDAVAAYVESQRVSLLAEQRSWPDVTDVDRLRTAFRAMNRSGITAQLDFTCCMNCGVSEIGEYAKPGDKGYVFFHEQDTARAIGGGDLMLAYGAYRSATAVKATDIADQAIGELRRAGLTVEWSGSPDARILLTPFTWRNRLTS